MSYVGVSGGRTDVQNADWKPGAWILKLGRTRERLEGSPVFVSQRDADTWVSFNYRDMDDNPIYSEFSLRG